MMQIQAKEYTSGVEMRVSYAAITLQMRKLRERPTALKAPEPHQPPVLLVHVREDANFHVRIYRAWQAKHSDHTLPIDFIRASCFLIGITYDELTKDRRRKEWMRIRRTMIQETAARYPELSSVRLGQLFKRDHTVILTALDRESRAPKHKAKLTLQQARSIKYRCLSRGEMQKDLAKEYGVSRAAICAIATGRTWREIE